uniref:Uncharacterized protein n=1 Tax=Romanomermis culicivorax TaxID=13658 RepID=A0A915IJ42_ROMCU
MTDAAGHMELYFICFKIIDTPVKVMANAGWEFPDMTSLHLQVKTMVTFIIVQIIDTPTKVMANARWTRDHYIPIMSF